MAYQSLMLVLFLVVFSSGKSVEKEKKKIQKLMGKLDNLFDKSNGKQSKTTLDVGFLVENPYKHDKHGAFRKSMNFVTSLSKTLQVSDMGNHVGLVTYGKTPYMVFDLNEYFAINDISDAIKGAPRPSYGSHTGRALMFAKKQLFDGSSRPESRKALVILTSKSSTDKVYEAADALKSSGVIVYAIGIDANDGLVELNDVASDPIENHKLLTKSSQLQDLVKPVADLLQKDAQRIPRVPPPERKPVDTNPAISAAKHKDETPQTRSNFEDGETNPETQDQSDDGGSSSLAEPTGKPMEDQGNDPTMPPDSLPEESRESQPKEKSDQPTEVTSSENPTMAPAAEPKEDEDKKTQKQDVTSEEQEPEATKPQQEKLAMPTVPSSTPAPLPTKQAESPVETPTNSPVTTPTKSDAKVNKIVKLSMPTTPTQPSSTPAPLPTEQVKLSMPIAPTQPSSTPAPLPTEQASPKTESQSQSPSSPPVLSPTKSDAEKPKASSKPKPSAKASPTKTVAPKAAATTSILSAKNEPTMPPKELPVEASDSRRSNITAVKSDPLDELEDSEAGSGASSSQRSQKKDDQDVLKESKDDKIVEDVLEKANIFNIKQNDSDDTAVEVAKLFNQSVVEEHLHVKDSSKKSESNSKTKQAAQPKPKPLPYTRTQPASKIRGKVCKARVDLVFLLDGSKATDKMRFTKSLTFVKDIIKSFSVSKDDTRVSVAVCSEKPHIVFDLSAFTDQGSIGRAMNSVTYPSGKMFAGGCLKTIKSAIFENSGRHGVPKILYFMSGADSSDRVALPSRALRDLGVQVFSLGLGTKYNAHELKEIATAPYSDHVLATRYEILGLLRPFVTAQLCRGSGGKLVPRAVNKFNNKPLVKRKKGQNERQAKSKVPSRTESGLRKSMLSKLKEKEEQKKAALKADIRKKLHILLAKLGREKFHDENAIFRSIVYNINGHRDGVGCKDYHILCKTWANKGYCKTSAKHGIDAFSVQRVCPKTCAVCYQ